MWGFLAVFLGGFTKKPAGFFGIYPGIPTLGAMPLHLKLWVVDDRVNLVQLFSKSLLIYWEWKTNQFYQLWTCSFAFMFYCFYIVTGNGFVIPVAHQQSAHWTKLDAPVIGTCPSLVIMTDRFCALSVLVYHPVYESGLVDLTVEIA